MKLKETHKYDDIIHLPHWVSPRRARMSNYDRAAQFSPFAALTGYDAVIEETARLTDSRIELCEGEKARLDEKLQALRENISLHPRVTVTHFIYDEKKSGGAYISTTGHVKKIDEIAGRLFLAEGAVIPVQEIIELELKP